MKNWLQRVWSRVTSIPSVSPLRRFISIGAGVTVSDESSMQVAAFYRGLIYISTQVAKLPWQVKSRDNEVIDNQLAILLDLAPNSEMSAFTFRLLAIQQAIIYGNFYAEIERNSLGQPTALWPLDPKAVDVRRRNGTGALYYKVTSNSAENYKSDVELSPKDVFHIKNFHTKDGILGQGVVAYGKDVLGISLAADQMAAGLFANGGLPSGVLSFPGSLADETFDRIKQTWQEAHGRKKAGGVAILEEGAKFEPVTMDPEVLQFLESRKFGVVEIARFLGVNPKKLYDLSGSGYNTIEDANLEVANDTIDCWAVNCEMEADIKLLNLRYGGRFTELDLYSLFRGDMKSRSEYFSKQMQVSAITPNEIRRLEGRAPYEGGDRFYVAANNFSPADRVDEIVDAQVKKNEPAPTNNAPTGSVGTDSIQNVHSEKLESAVIQFLERK